MKFVIERVDNGYVMTYSIPGPNYLAVASMTTAIGRNVPVKMVYKDDDLEDMIKRITGEKQ